MIYREVAFQKELQLFHRASGIPFCVFDNEPKDILRYPLIANMDCSPKTLFRCREALKRCGQAQGVPILYSSSVCFLALLRLDDNTNVIFGPVSSVPLTYREFYNCGRIECELDDLLHLYRIIQQCPHFTLAQFASNLALFIQLVFHKEITVEEVLAAHHISYPPVPMGQIMDEVEEPHYVTIAEAIDFQKKTIEHIRKGDISEVRGVFGKTSFFDNLENSPSTIRDLEKIFFIYATVCCVAVMEAGLELQQAFPIFDTYISKIPSITAPEKLGELCMQLSIDYCEQMIPLQGGRSDSLVVRNCLQYIQKNIYLRITVNDLAQYCNVSTRTVTRHFSEYYYMTVAECVLFYKLKEAAFLLSHSNFTLAEISNQLAFSSQSHFTVAFKKKYSYTPQKYREKFIRECL